MEWHGAYYAHDMNVFDSLQWFLRGRWLVGHIVVLAIVVLMGNLAVWQFDRRHERIAENAQMRHELSRPPTHALEGSEWQPVELTGRFAASSTVLLRHRMYEGRTGYEVLVPFIPSGDASADSTSVWVNRGWVSLDAGEKAPLLPNDDAIVVISGWHRDAPRTQRGTATLDAPQFNAGSPAIPIVDRFPHRFIQLDGKRTSGGESLDDVVARPLPELDEGPHLSYAWQWIGFGIVGVVGWLTLVWRAHRDRQIVRELRE